MKKKSMMLGGAITLGVIAAAYFVLSQQSVEVSTATAGREKMTLYVEELADAKLKAYEIVYGQSLGIVETVPKAVGETVKAGEVLFQLNDESLLLQIEEMRQQLVALYAEYESAKSTASTGDIRHLEAAYRSAQKAYEVAQSGAMSSQVLFSSGAVSREEYQQALGQLQLKEAEMLKAQTNLSQTKEGISASQEKQYAARIAATEARINTLTLQLSQLSYKSPMDGIILSLFVDKGAYVSPGLPLVEVGNPKTLYFTSDLLVEDLRGIKIGTSVQLTHDSLDAVLEGKVESIAPIAVNVISDLGINQKRVGVTIDLVKPIDVIKAGYTMTARFILAEKEDTLTIDEDALFMIENQTYVFVVESGKAKLRPVSVGLEMANRIEILDGLEVNEKVILSPDDVVQDGVAVSLTTPN